MKQTKQLLIGLSVGFALVGLGFLLLKKKSHKIKSILFVGDSNTFANFSYADKIKKLFPNLITKKVAKNGATTEWMNERVRDELKAYNYDLIAILGGSNDIYGAVRIDKAKKNLDEMFKMAKLKGTKVLVITPPNKDFYTKKTEKNQELLNDLVDWIMSNKNVDYKIDFHKLTNDKSLFSANDGYLHPQSKAHELIVNEFNNKIKLA
jgi:lysophospholipase L1-like esterase